MKVKKIQENNNLQLYKKKEKLKEKGITLIALVVTIIILLILAGVTLNMALSGDGLFSRARNAADKYKKAQEEEEKLISEIGKEMYSEYVGAYVTGYEPTGGTCTITKEQSGVGNDVTKDASGKEIKKDAEGNQKFTTTAEGELKWRIWDYDGTMLRIILDRPTKQELMLKGIAGYNNGVWAINEVCRKCFGQYENGEMKEGISVANLRRSDIQKVSNYDFTEYTKSDEDNNIIKFGQAREYNITCPKIMESDSQWNYEYKDGKKIGNDKDCLLLEEEGNGDLEDASTTKVNQFKESYYEYNYDENNFINSVYFDLVFSRVAKEKTTQYWLSGRMVELFLNDTIFGINGIGFDEDKKLVGAYDVFVTGGRDAINRYMSCRPVVSINLDKTNLKLTRIEENGEVSFKLEN